jgi:hypothetical protein
VAAAIAGVETKVLRADLADIGVTPRERVGPRVAHPLRGVFDRVVRTLGVSDVELVVTSRVSRARVLSLDVPWVIVPASLADSDEPVQLVHIARAVSRIAFGVPWLEELQPENVGGLLIAAARHVAPGYASASDESALAAQYGPALGRAFTRRQKRLLDELAPHLLSPDAPPLDVRELLEALRRAEVRTAYLVAGDLLAIVDDQASIDPVVRDAIDTPSTHALAAVLEHPLLGDAVRFALTSEATALRHRVGSIWVR